MMRMATTIVIAMALLIPFYPVGAVSEDIIEISSYEELTDIGVGLPSDGHYVLTDDIVLPSLSYLEVLISRSPDTVSMTVTADGYDAGYPVGSLRVIVNGECRTVTADLPTVIFPDTVINGRNIVYLDLDGMCSMGILPAGTFSDGERFHMCAGSNIGRIDSTFTGILDGAGHAVSGIGMIGEDRSLFRCSDGAVFRNITLRGNVSSFLYHNAYGEEGSLSYDVTCRASALVLESRDTVFERIIVESDVISMLVSESTVEQSSDMYLSFRTMCERDAVSGAVTAESTGCEFISCTTSGTVASCIGSVVRLDTLVRPLTIDMSSDTERNMSMTVCGGISGDSENDRFAYCSDLGSTMTVSNDRVLMDMYDPGWNMPSDDRIQSICCSGSVGGVMVSSTMYGCTDLRDHRSISYKEVSFPGTHTHDDRTGSLTGISKGCSISVCRTSNGEASAYPVDDRVSYVSKDTVIPGLLLETVWSLKNVLSVNGVDGNRSVTEHNVLFHSGYDIEPHMVCNDGSMILMEKTIVLNPEFDWMTMSYSTMKVEVREEDRPVPGDLIVLVALCAVTVMSALLMATSLRRT